MATWRGIEYLEAVDAGPDEQYAQDASRALRVLRVREMPDLARRQLIAQQFVGYAQRKLTPAGKPYISRITPHFYPPANDLGEPYLYAASVVRSRMMGLPGSEDSPRHAPGDRTAWYAWWEMTLEYRSQPWDVAEDNFVLARQGPLFTSADEAYPDEGDALRRGWANTRYVSKHPEPGGRVIPLRQGAFYYVGVADAFGHDVPTLEPFPYNETLQHVNYFWAQVPLDCLPLLAVQSQLNTVNNATFDGYPAGTLLFIDSRQTPRRDPFGQRTLDVNHRFLFAPRCNPGGVPLGHNAILRIDRVLGPRWTLVSTDATNFASRLPYPGTDFSALFRPDQP